MDNKDEVIELLIKCGKILGINYHPVKTEKTEEQKEIEEINKIVSKYRKKKIKQKTVLRILVALKIASKFEMHPEQETL